MATENCIICNQPVSPTNDVASFDALLTAKPLLYNLAKSKHLLPITSETGEVLCTGSPSRAQYIEGQPRDTRDQFPYKTENESLYRSIFAEMQKLS